MADKKKQKVESSVKQVKKKQDSKSLKEQIKAMEQKKRAKKVEAAPSKISFDSWFHLRKQAIPRQHLKEIIWSYFKSRGLTKEETLQRYDEELRRYGVKI